RGEYVPGPCTHRPSHHGSWVYPKAVRQPFEGAADHEPDRPHISSERQTLSWSSGSRQAVGHMTSGSKAWGLSSAGRAPDLHSGGQEFDPPRLHHLCLARITLRWLERTPDKREVGGSSPPRPT
ncbi:unnamed protein product, partial [Laminaria digitata]